MRIKLIWHDKRMALAGIDPFWLYNILYGLEYGTGHEIKNTDFIVDTDPVPFIIQSQPLYPVTLSLGSFHLK